MEIKDSYFKFCLSNSSFGGGVFIRDTDSNITIENNVF